MKFWEWMSAYYLASPGEVMQAALPAGLKLSSESRVILDPSFEQDFTSLSDDEYLVAEALSHQQELTLDDVQQILRRRTVLPTIRQMMEKGVVVLHEELTEGFSEKKEEFLSLATPFDDKQTRKDLFDELERRAPRQLEVLMAFMQARTGGSEVAKTSVLQKAGKHSAALKALVDKGVLVSTTKTVSRLQNGKATSGIPELTQAQQTAQSEILRQWTDHRVVLLHGVTSSGKTEVYAHLIDDFVKRGKQVLYLLPEIALTAQMIARLTRYFGPKIGVYHSRFGDNERVEIWQKVLSGDYRIVLGARSSLFLPFSDLGLIVIDEEHDASFKQFDPAPRYHARDAAIWLADHVDAKVLLGSATPSLESIFNARENKYGIVRLTKRFGDIELPGVRIAALSKVAVAEHRKLTISHDLVASMKKTLEEKRQVILFRNRRGFSPLLICKSCDYVPKCPNCDVSLTYHKAYSEMRCHYCHYRAKAVTTCPSCGSHNIQTQGFGTERVEEDLRIAIPTARVARLDYDAVRTKRGHDRIINDFSEGRADILVGTQMVTKGLDFENVSLVGILQADQLWVFPDYRSDERAFQLMLQVSGRAGRKGRQGEVIIEARDTTNPLLRLAVDNDLDGFYNSALQHRRKWRYPPYTRLIQLRLKHRDRQVVRQAAEALHQRLAEVHGKRIYKPSEPFVDRVRNKYLMDILIKIERRAEVIREVKSSVLQAIDWLGQQKGWSGVDVVIDVDVY
jgi:primosomal protein N' (replication factor Y)